MKIDKSYFITNENKILPIWRSDNRFYIIKNMDLCHIKNILNCMEDKSLTKIKFPVSGKSKKTWKRIFKDELNMREKENCNKKRNYIKCIDSY